jgi:hypothetical protein
LEKHKIYPYYSPKISKLYKVEEKFIRNNFPFDKKFKFPTEFELKFQKQNNLKFGLNLKGV